MLPIFDKQLIVYLIIRIPHHLSISPFFDRINNEVELAHEFSAYLPIVVCIITLFPCQILQYSISCDVISQHIDFQQSLIQSESVVDHCTVDNCID